MSVSDDQGRTGESFRFLKGQDGLAVLRTEGDTSHVHVFILHGHQREVLLRTALPIGGKSSDRAERRGLGGLPSRVRVNFCIKHEDADIITRSENVIEATVSDIVGPP